MSGAELIQCFSCNFAKFTQYGNIGVRVNTYPSGLEAIREMHKRKIPRIMTFAQDTQADTTSSFVPCGRYTTDSAVCLCFDSFITVLSQDTTLNSIKKSYILVIQGHHKSSHFLYTQEYYNRYSVD